MFTSIAGSVVPGGFRARRARRAAGAADAWFLALDQEVVAVGPQRWRLHVMGVHATRGILWIQLQPAPESALSIVLKVGRNTTVDDALVALAWAELPTSWPLVITATRPRRSVAHVPRPRPLKHSSSPA